MCDNEESVCGIFYNGMPYYFQKNLQGDIIGITDQNGAVKARYSYDAWGVCTIAQDHSEIGIATINPYRYRGYYYDAEIGLYYLSSRYYNPGIGRWISSDEATIGVFSSLALSNLYNYCLNNPVQYTDPSGFLPTWAKIAIGIVGIIASVVLTIATGGAALPALIATLKVIVGNVAISMALGGLIGYIAGGVSGLKKGLLDGALDGFMWGGIGAAVSVATKLIKGTKAFVAIKSAVKQSAAVKLLIKNASKLKYTKTVMKHINSRPYMKSSLIIQEIMKAVKPVADKSLKNGYKWVVDGFVIINGRAQTGIWELVIDASTKTVVHFLFKH